MAREWYKDETATLARHVASGALDRHFHDLGVNGPELVLTFEGRRRLTEALYEALLAKGINYLYDPHRHNPENEYKQWVRSAEDILEGQREGTCLDLAVLFCGLCLDAGLLPLLVL